MVKFKNSYYEYTLAGKIGSICKSKHLDSLVFEIEANYQDPFSKQQIPQNILIFPHINPLTLNGKLYRIENNDDVIAFRAILEAAVMEDILNDKGDAGKQKGD